MRTSRPRTITVVMMCILMCLSTACTSMRPITPDATGEQVRLTIRAGDTVHVVSKNGPSHSFRVTTVGTSSLTGNVVKTWEASADVAGSQVEVPYADIAQIEVKRVSGLKTAGIIAAIVAVAIAIASGGGSHQAGYGSR